MQVFMGKFDDRPATGHHHASHWETPCAEWLSHRQLSLINEICLVQAVQKGIFEGNN